MKKRSGLVRKRHRRGKKRRVKLRLALRVAASLLVLGVAVALSAGMIHVVERPLPPFELLADQLRATPDPTMPQALDPETELSR